MALIDRHSRIHDYLRISLTDNCNLRCTYCMPSDKNDFSPPGRLMQAGEIHSIAGIFTELGVRKIRLTGGEPLVRKDAGEIILALSELPVELTISTNGVLIGQYLDTFIRAGIRSVNISLDSLDPETFFRITHRNDFQKVMDGIQTLIGHGFHVKLNMVVMKGVNESEIPGFIELTKNQALHVRFIEYMPFSGNQWSRTGVFTHREILSLLDTQFDYIKLGDEKHDTAKKYKVIGYKGSFALISTMTEPFCSGCNRLRLTADGKMKNCLFSKTEMDLLTAYRDGKDIRTLIMKNLSAKEKERGGQIKPLEVMDRPAAILNRSMVAIGG